MFFQLVWKNYFQVSIKFRGKTYTLSLSQMRKMVEGADKGGALKGADIAVKQRKARSRIVLPRVPM